MPSATLDAIVYRSTNPVQRAMDVICLIMLQLLALMVLAAEQNQEKLRNHRALGPNSILARLDAGETFDLPLLWVASMRSMVNLLRADLRLDVIGANLSGSPLPALPQTAPARTKAKPRRPAAPHRGKPNTSRVKLLAPRASNPSIAPPPDDPRPRKRIDLVLPRLTTSISLRYSNERKATGRPQAGQRRCAR